MKLLLTILTGFLIQFSAAGSDTTLLLRNTSYSKVFELAKKEKKAVMLFFTFDGCGACMTMKKTAFVDKKVANFYNAHFVSFEVNTRKGEGIETNKIYNVKMHPTFLFLDENGNTLNKLVGVFSPEEFVVQAQDALNPLKTLTYYKQQYKNGKREPEFLYEYCYKLRDSWELDSLLIIEYLNTQMKDDLSNAKNIGFIYEYAIYQGKVCIPFESPAFKIMQSRKELFTPRFDLEQVNTRLMFIVQDAVYQYIESLNEKSFYKAIDELKQYDGKLYDFKELDGRITMWTSSKTLVLGAEMAFYEKKGDFNKYNQLLTDYIKSMWNDQTALNSFAWSYYERFDDKNKLEQAVKCIKRSIELNSNYNNNDTYAALLYKLGDFNKALEQAKAAIVLAKQKNINFAGTNELIEKIKEKQKQ